MSEEVKYVATPLGILTTILGDKEAKQAIDALELHMRRFYGPTPGIVLDGNSMFFVKLASEPI